MFEFLRKSKKRVYLDYASATPILSAAARAVGETWATYGNPGSIHAEGVRAASLLKQARASIARELACKDREVIFTSGGTEANNLAIVGRARYLERMGVNLSKTHWVVSAIEHPSVLDAFGEVERLGGVITFVEPDAHGIIRPEAVARELKKETVFVSVGWGNGEIGTIAPLSAIAQEIRTHEKLHESEVLFHSDAGQTPLYLSTQPHTLGVDLLTLDSAKLYGPRGIGVLYVSARAMLSPVLFGGKQERALRPGTENTALAHGFAVALGFAASMRMSEAKRLRVLRDNLARSLTQALPQMIMNGDLKRSLPHILNISIPHIKSEYLVLRLDRAGFALSTKSACREGEESRSHIVEALGGEAWRAQNTLRISLGYDTHERDMVRFIETLRSEVSVL